MKQVHEKQFLATTMEVAAIFAHSRLRPSAVQSKFFKLQNTSRTSRYLQDTATMSAQASQHGADSGKVNFPTDASLPGEYFEVRQTHPTGDYKPDPSKSLPLSPARQSLLDDIIALYEMKPTVERIKRYTPDCVYNDQFVYANDRYKMAGQWLALPKLFNGAKSHGYEIVTNDRDLIQFKHEEVMVDLRAPALLS